MTKISLCIYCDADTVTNVSISERRAAKLSFWQKDGQQLPLREIVATLETPLKYDGKLAQWILDNAIFSGDTIVLPDCKITILEDSATKEKTHEDK